MSTSEKISQSLLTNQNLSNFIELKDPIYNNQLYNLHSFVPSKDAVPDKDGVFGFIKIRGSFHSLDECNSYAEKIIREIDDKYPILTTYAGRPFPVCINTEKYTLEKTEIDLNSKVKDVYEKDEQSKKSADMKKYKELQEREKKLLEDVDPNKEIDLCDEYTMQMTKRAQMIYTYLDYKEKILKIRDIIEKTHIYILKLDEEYPEFKLQYMNRYLDARKESGIPVTDESFIKYMGCENGFTEQIIQTKI